MQGFVYRITNLRDGRIYFGKKFFKFARTRGPLKGRKRKRRDKVESDWKDYWGSNKALVADVELHGPDSFRREILFLCRNKAECAYREAKIIFESDALRNPDRFYNRWISVKINGVGLVGNSAPDDGS